MPKQKAADINELEALASEEELLATIESLDDLPPELYDDLDNLSKAIESYAYEIDLQRLKRLYRPITGSASDRRLLSNRERQLTRDRAYELLYTPLVQNIIEQYASFSFSGGFSEPTANDPNVAKTISHFWKHPANKSNFTTLKAQKELTRKCFIDGEVIVSFCVSFHTGNVTVRMMDSADLIDPITDPADEHRNIFYKMTDRLRSRNYNYGQGKYKVSSRKKYWHYYADIQNVDWNESFKHKRVVPIISGPDTKQLNPNSAIYFLKLNTITEDLRGIPLLNSILQFVHNYNSQAEQFRTYIAALVRIAALKKYKGVPTKFVERLVQAQRPRVSPFFNSGPRNSQVPVGGTKNTNENLDYSLLDVPTGGVKAFEDAFLQSLENIASGTGLTVPNISGNPKYGKLSTDTNMELPQLMRFKDFQFLMRDLYKAVIDNLLIISVASRKKKIDATVMVEDDYPVIKNMQGINLAYTLNLPSVMTRNLSALASALSVAVLQLGFPEELAMRIFSSEFDISEEDLQSATADVKDSRVLEALKESHDMTQEEAEAALKRANQIIRISGGPELHPEVLKIQQEESFKGVLRDEILNLGEELKRVLEANQPEE